LDFNSYIAFSYTWGESYEDDSHLSDYVICDGQLLPATPNLVQALKRIRQAKDWLRRRGWDRATVWADAISINQKNDAERNAQVKVMSSIYSMASLIVVWLGDLDENDWNSLRNCDWIKSSNPDHTIDSAELVPEWDEKHALEQDFELSRDDPLGEIGKPGRKAQLKPLDEVLFKKPWFSRRWVIQEARAPTALYIFAHNLIMEKRLFDAGTFGYGSNSHISSTPPFRSTCTYGFEGPCLLGNLHALSEADCSDPRDRVFALLSISKDGPSIRVDYTQTVEAVHMSVALFYLDRSHLFVILMCASIQTVRGEALKQNVRRQEPCILPTLVPDWRQGQHSHSIGQSNALKKFWQGINSPGLAYLGTFSRDGPMLCLEGWPIDENNKVNESSPDICVLQKGPVNLLF
jgi:hypothetical protein